MMSTSVDLLFNIIGRDHASKALNTAGKSAKDFDEHLTRTHKSMQMLKTAGLAMAGSLAAMGVAAAGAAILTIGKQSLIAASDLAEVSSAIEQTFGAASAKNLSAWSKTAATALGQSQTQALDAAKNFGIFGKAAGLSGGDLEKFSTDFTVLAADLASFNNTTPQEAIEALGAGLRGESEPLRRYGVLLDDATLKARATTMGIYDGNGALTSQQKILASQAEILAQTSLQQGDFARTSTGMANAQRIVKAQSQDLMATIGTGVLPVVTDFTNRMVKAFPSVQAAVEKAMPAVSASLVGLADQLQAKWPEISDTMQSFAAGFREQWPEIKSTAEAAAKGLERVGSVMNTLWGAFRSLPPEVQSTLATLAVLQKTGAISVAFKGADLFKNMFLKTPAVAIQAGSVTVTGATPVTGATGAATGAAGKTAAGSSAMTLAGVNVPAVVAAVMAAGAIVAIHQLVTGGAATKTAEQGGNAATLGGSWQAMGAGGTNSGAGNPFGIEKLKEYQAAVDLASIAQARLNSAQAAGVVTAGQYGKWSENFGTALMSTAGAVKMNGEELRAMGAAVAAIPPGSSIAEVEAVVSRFGKSAGMTEEEISAMSAAIVGIPGGSTMEQLLPGLQTAANAAGATEGEIRLMSASIAGIPGGASVESLSSAISRAGTSTGMTQAQIRQMSDAIASIPVGSNADVVAASIAQAGAAAQLSEPQIKAISDAVMGIPPGTSADQVAASISAMGVAAGLTKPEIDAITASVLGIPPAAATTITAPGAPQSAREIAEHTNQAGLVPYARSTSVSAPGAPGSAGQLRDVRSAADQVNGTRSIYVHAETSNAYNQLNSLLSWARSQTVTILSKILPGGATGMSVPAFASGGTPMMVSNGEFYASPATVARTGGTGVWHALNTGMIAGPGTGTSDSIQALGQPGGFVLNARATRRYRPVLRHLADGGPTGAVATMTAPTTTERVALYIDGRMIHESLIRLKRERGGADLGLS